MLRLRGRVHGCGLLRHLCVRDGGRDVDVGGVALGGRVLRLFLDAAAETFGERADEVREEAHRRRGSGVGGHKFKDSQVASGECRESSRAVDLRVARSGRGGVRRHGARIYSVRLRGRW